MADATLELESFFQTDNLTPEQFEQFANGAYATARTRERFEQLLSEYEAGTPEPLRLALARVICGRYQAALEAFAQAGDSGLRWYQTAQAHRGLGQTEEALAALEKAAANGWDELTCAMERAAVHVQRREVDQARQLLDQHAGAASEQAKWIFVRGLIREAEDDRAGALEDFEQALSRDEDHESAGFRAALLHDRFGDDERAIELYEQLAERPRSHVNALMNLAVIYEDHGKYERAATCLRRVLRLFPNHARARLFLKDVESSREMVIDEGHEPREESHHKLFDLPIQEFELSVRARNCLKKMKIDTLGQLLRLTETELLAYKNFGETSLAEIKNLLSKRGLRLGQRPEDIDPETVVEPPAPKVSVPPGSEAILNKPVSELELSVRARRCLQRLNIVTVGDLIQHSENDLLQTRNFGVTSLNEIKARLDDLNLQLAPKQ